MAGVDSTAPGKPNFANEKYKMAFRPETSNQQKFRNYTLVFRFKVQVEK